MAVDPQHKYSNESEGTTQDIYDDFISKKPFGLHGLEKKYFSALRVNPFTAKLNYNRFKYV